MANIKISQLPPATTVSADVDVLPMVHSGVTQKVTPDLLVQTVLGAPGPIGADVAGSAAFTTLTASGAVTLNPADADVALSPTGSGAVNIQPNGGLLVNPASVGSMNNVAIGGATPQPGTFTALTSTSTTTLNGTTIPSSVTLVDTDSAQTLAQKTLAYPRIWDPDRSNYYRITPVGNLSLDVYTFLPVLTGNDYFSFRNFAETLTNKTISGATNTLTDIGNAALTNSSITIGSSSVSLGGTLSSVSGLSINNSAIGASTASTGAFTTLSASSTVTINGGTANGVAYLNGSKVLTTGTALTFDGTNFGVGGTQSYSGYRTISAKGTTAIAGGVFQTNTSDDGLQAFFYTASGESRLGTITNHPQVFVINNGEQARLTANGLGIGYTSLTGSNGLAVAGNVGIGTSSPARKLDVVGSIQLPSNNALYINGSNNYLYADTAAMELASATKISLVTNGALRATLDSSGNLGLGVTPSAWATVTAMQVKNAAFIGFGETAYVSGNAYFNGGWKYIASSGAGRYDVDGGFGGIHRWYTAPSGTAGSAISFTQAMTLTAAGDLLVGTTTLGNDNSNSFIFSKTGGYIIVNHVNGSGSGSGYASFGYNGGEIGSITQNGTNNVLYNTSSDYRLKENVKPIQNALSRLSQLKPSTYNWIADGSDGEGFIAHELQEVVPQAVSGEKDGEKMQGVDYGKLTPLLTAAIQELSARLETLENKVN